MARRGDSLEMAVLGLLHESPLHGYELRKRLNLLLGWSRLLSYGSLYPALKKMLRAGWISDEFEPTAVTRRQRITYTITDAGREHFASRDDRVRARPRGRTTASTSGSCSSRSPTTTSACGSSRVGAPGCRSGSTGSA